MADVAVDGRVESLVSGHSGRTLLLVSLGGRHFDLSRVEPGPIPGDVGRE